MDCRYPEDNLLKPALRGIYCFVAFIIGYRLYVLLDHTYIRTINIQVKTILTALNTWICKKIIFLYTHVFLNCGIVCFLPFIRIWLRILWKREIIIINSLVLPKIDWGTWANIRWAKVFPQSNWKENLFNWNKKKVENNKFLTEREKKER